MIHLQSVCLRLRARLRMCVCVCLVKSNGTRVSFKKSIWFSINFSDFKMSILAL
jgi:hypothetical protein